MTLPRAVPPRLETVRQALRDALSEGLRTAHELSRIVAVAERDVVAHLEHLQRTAKARDERFVVEPARCDACGFVFKKRDRLGRPSRCPVCREDRVVGPRFAIEK